MDENGYATLKELHREALAYICTTEELVHTPSYAVVREEDCVGCGTCKKVGSCVAIAMRDNRAFVDPGLCEGCGLCQSVCGRGCISFRPREGA